MSKTRQRTLLLLAILAITLCSQAFGLSRYTQKRNARRSSLRRIHWNPMFRPSRDSLLLQNKEVDRLELPRIQNDEELEELKSRQELVPIIPGTTLRIDPRLDPGRRYCRPWTLEFLQDLSTAFHKQFGAQIQVNSAVRTVIVQKKLRRHNRNAAPETGETASSHLAGITVDIQRRGLSRQQIKWVQQYMLPLKIMGLIEPEEERRQWVFHVMVSDRYSDWRGSKTPRQTEVAGNAVDPNAPPVVPIQSDAAMPSISLERTFAAPAASFVPQLPHNP